MRCCSPRCCSFALKQKAKPGVDNCFLVAAIVVVLLDVAYDKYGPPMYLLAPLAVIWFWMVHDALHHGLFDVHFMFLTVLYCLHAVIATYADLATVSVLAE